MRRSTDVHGRAEAHHEAMFNSYDMTRAFVTERQQTLRHEARQHHLGRGRRRGQAGGRSGVGSVVPTVRPAPLRATTAPADGGAEEQRAA